MKAPAAATVIAVIMATYGKETDFGLFPEISGKSYTKDANQITNIADTINCAARITYRGILLLEFIIIQRLWIPYQQINKSTQ